MNVKDFERHFRSTFKELVGSRIVVALSGGADSVALLNLLQVSDLGLQLVAAHIHHGIRGQEADDDAAFCERLCARLDLPFDLWRLPRIPPGPEGRESGWRQARYAALQAIASKYAAAAIATGHHRDDIAEGVLMQLIRGTGPRAMAGIADRQGAVIRPLLPWTHDELCRWLNHLATDWREDTSNASPQHLRNRVRHEVIPLLEKIAPSTRGHLVRLARALATDEAYLASQLERHALWIDPWHPDGGVAVAAIASLDPALQVRWLHAQAERAALGRVTNRQGELLRPLLNGEIGALTLAGRWVLRTAGARLWLEPPHPISPFECSLGPGLEIFLPIPSWAATYRRPATEDLPNAWRYPCQPGRRFTLRSARPGDRLTDDVPVQSLLRRKVPRHLRRSWPILCDGAKILWIPGVGHGTGSSGGDWIVEVMRT